MSTDDVIERVETEGGDARAKARRAGALTFSHALLASDWSRRDPAVVERLRRVDNRRIDYLRSLFGTFCSDWDDVEIRSTLAFSLALGTPIEERKAPPLIVTRSPLSIPAR
ncbi:hypothetical protein ACQEVF_53020 [Nonomuraea polychroma]|uniref:hypothetical protein n=1 Tax=Nonomuraea polychroma TaxID=46176 RepID=UPI003D8BE202